MNCKEESAVKKRISDCLTVLSKYTWLHDSLVHDFFVDNHWSRMPASWQTVMAQLSQGQLSNFIRFDSCFTTGSPVLPLELLALRSTVSRLSLTRHPVPGVQDVLDQVGVGSDGASKGDHQNSTTHGHWRSYAEEISRAGGQHKNLHNLFRKHVKPKKQHEIARMASLCSSLCSHYEIQNVVDVGSGVGHLSRLLSFGHGMRVTSVDGQSNYVDTAEKFDKQLEKSANKKARVLESQGPDHLAAYVDFNDKNCLEKTLGPNEDFGIIGLHTCGDLGPSLTNFFCQCDRVRVLAFVGCCHMKLTSGFPMSDYVRGCCDLTEKTASLGYLSRELSCHAIETYVSRLIDSTEAEKLKVHCYRALLEKLIANSSRPDLRHSALQRVARSYQLTFQEYALRATKHLDIDLRLDEKSELICDLTSQWWNIVVFYSLRLLLAPLIETVVLLDRMLSVQERGFRTALIPIFDPELSPRNHVLVAVKD